MPQQYPFSAVVGADDPDNPLALSLILSTISPEIGGVLIRGEKGTAKSTIVRALAGVLPPIEVVSDDRFSSDPHDSALSPDGPFAADAPTEIRPVRLVELPVGASEDRVVGSLHLESALSHGRTEYEPGLLAKAHRGILYVDEVNLLHDHLVDLLLDAAAMGRSTVERDGVSVVHAARFVLVGTMNPEEGELRPQLLDRFGLSIEVAAPRDPATRAEVVRRRMAYDADPDAFCARYAEAERALTDRIVSARKLAGQVELTDAALIKIAEVCAAFEVDGLRADIVTARTAVAHAAWQGRTRVLRADIRAAALLALPHRRRRNPFDAPGLDEDLLDRVLGDDEPDPTPPEDGPEDGQAPEDRDSDETAADPGDLADGPDGPGQGDAEGSPADRPTSPESSRGEEETPEPGDSAEPDDADSPDPETPGAEVPGSEPPGTVVAAGAPYRPRLFTVAGTGLGEAGRRSRAETGRGRRTGVLPQASQQTGPLHLTATIQAAAPHQTLRGRAVGAPLRLRAGDLRRARTEGRESNLVLFCVDASGSMAARTRMEPVKSAILSLLMDAYQRRDKVGLVTFRGAEGTLALPPTGSVEVAARRLDDLPAGGRTPLAEGLLRAAETLRIERIRDPRRRALLVVVTDGRATSGADAVRRSRDAAALLAGSGVTSLVVDCETGRFRMGLAGELATALAAEYVPLAEVTADALTGAVRDRTTGDHEGAA